MYIIAFASVAPNEEVFAQIAQLVEQRTENPRVTGSIPVLGIKFWVIQEHIMGY